MSGRGSPINGAISKWRGVVLHSMRTAVAALASVLVARMFKLPESYWAPITTMVITQSSLGAAFGVSLQRLIGTFFGALVGCAVATYFGHTLPVFAISVFVLGLVRAAVHSDRTAYRFGGITLAIVLLLPRPGPAWIIALHRFAEVSVGIVVALLFAFVWPESDEASEKRPIGSRDDDGVAAGNQRRTY